MPLSDCLGNSDVAIERVPSNGHDNHANLRTHLWRLARELGWGSAQERPFDRLLQDGARVLIKPNLVLHTNLCEGGISPLVTSSDLIQEVTKSALESSNCTVLVGDAPVQGCDFEVLLALTGLRAWADGMTAREPRFRGIQDFRRTTCDFRNGLRSSASENVLPMDLFVLFDLGTDSLLEPVTEVRPRFRVTCYDPATLALAHRPGRHQYLVSREVLDANLIINLPKLKTHKKAGITCALKNLVGINGNKEYLPHHRVGGSLSGGDCYPGRSALKRTQEWLLDQQNRSRSPSGAAAWHYVASLAGAAAARTGDSLGVEGSWSGNDTVWRMCLDLNRILLYGTVEGTLADTVQRRVVHIADGMVAGQGDGPLAPTPLALGLLLASENPWAMDWVAAHLLNMEPSRIALVREASGKFRWPISISSPEDIHILDGGRHRVASYLSGLALPKAVVPRGWLSAQRRR